LQRGNTLVDGSSQASEPAFEMTADQFLIGARRFG